MVALAHTPGPWHVGASNAPARAGCTIVDGQSGKSVCAAPGVIVAEDDTADLVLAAAAPDLLEALESAVTALPAYSEEAKQARAAIAKATEASHV